ncbi:unnamed protein product [Somion occarium]|uniref:Uncharacterized protein n=1 Tax=Somion occarium TaxID=3059160 RepID=A0ABP1CXT7_9APHY
MSSTRPNASKKPSGGRPLPKRLFSFDSLRKQTSGHDSENSDREQTLRLVEKSVLEDGDGALASGGRWLEKEPMHSPTDETPRKTPPVTKERFRARRQGSKPMFIDPESANASDTGPEDIGGKMPVSPSRRRWDTLRQHVIPSSSSFSELSTHLPSTPSDTTSIISSAAPSRPSTPKPSRFGVGKKGMRQVVEEARVDYESRKTLEEIRKACWTVRFGDMDPRAPPKMDREGSQGSGVTGIHIPFVNSNTQLPMHSSSSVMSLPMTMAARGGLRRPPSVQSFATTTSNASGSPVGHLVSLIAALKPRPKELPLEQDILSALLVPFLTPSRFMNVELEQGTATEMFDFIRRAWPSFSDEDELERCLWCCKAASVPSTFRGRILGSLSGILFSREGSFQAKTPLVLQTLLHSMFSLLFDLSFSSGTTSESDSVAGWIMAIREGQCGELSQDDLEKEYGVRYSKTDKDDSIREAIVAETVAKCLEIGSECSRRWALHKLLKDYWPVPEPHLTLTPLLVCIHWRKLKIFLSSALVLLSSNAEDGDESDDLVVVEVFRSRILPELEAMRTDVAADIQSSVVRLVLELLCIRQSDQREYLLMHFCDWYQNKPDWKASIEKTLSQLIESAEWRLILRLIPTVAKELPDEIQLPVISFILPLLTDRLIADPAEVPCHALCDFLEAISRAYPKVFYKPLFICAASSKEITVAAQLQTLAAISTYVPDFWTRDPEMMAVALMSDTTGLKGKAPAQPIPTWGKSRLGQSVLLIELIEQLRMIRHSKDMTATVPAVKFATALEVKLGILIEAKEQSTWIAEPQRFLFCALFREIRLLNRSLKSASWLPSVVSWCAYWQTALDDGDRTITHGDEAEDTETAFHKLLAMYIHVHENSRSSSKRRTTMVSIPSFDKPLAIKTSPSESNDLLGGFDGRVKLLTSMAHAPRAMPLELLVTICGMLGTSEYVRLAPVLWNCCFDDDARIIAPTCFLVMQCAEKCPSDFLTLAEADLNSPDSVTRVHALEKISMLSSWRFQLLSQEVILDRSFRRPFKLARPPILFVATDMGSSSWTYEEDANEWKDSHGNVLPLELRKRLSEIGWDEENRQVDPKMQWIRSPMSLLPSYQLDHLDNNAGELMLSPEPHSPSPSASPSASPQPSPVKPSSTDSALTRQDSNASIRSLGVKRRPVFVPTLLTLFPLLAKMVSDRDFSVSAAALDIVFDFMRDDPALIGREIFALLSGDEASVIAGISALRAFLHVRHVLPPAMAHFVLNHLTGFLKSLVRSTESLTPLQNYAYSVPIIANLFTQVSNLSMRELRRNKVDMFFVPTGSLWFPPTAPASSIFPRCLPGNLNPFDSLPMPLVWMTLDAQILRKNATSLVLPSPDNEEETNLLSLNNLLPRKPDINRKPWTPGQVTLRDLSLTLARSYLLLAGQIFQCLSRHLNDRAELSIWMDSISTILVRHGNDVGIVAHSMIVLMVACTRFRRFFTSGGGYTLFMPAVMKVYIEADHHPGIRNAIEYAASRFFALHQDTFVFQTLDVMTPVVTSPSVDDGWIASGIYTLFASLNGSVLASVPDAAGIHGLNRPQEKEALMITAAEEIPQTFLASLKRSNSQDNALPTIPVPDEYEGKRLGMDNFVRLFLTVIAYNPTSQRAEHFLRLLRLLAPQLYHASGSARMVLRDGTVALGNILLTKTVSKTKNVDEGHIQPADNFNTEVLAQINGQGPSSSINSRAGDPLVMRLDYLSLVIAFTKPGGLFSHSASQRIIELVKAILKESRVSVGQISTFIADFARHVLLREPPPPLKQVVSLLNDLAPVVSAYSTSVDFSGLYDVIAELAGNTVFGNERTFANLVINQYCRSGLDACELAASEGLLFSLPLRTSLLRLLQNTVAMVGADVMAELERKAPSHEFLAGVTLPFALSLKTAADIMAASQFADTWRRDAHARAWVRLLTYILSICRSVDSQGKHARKSSTSGSEKNGTPSFSSVMTFSIALQILKVIVVRAEDDISRAMPGIWAQIGMILRSSLSEGDASFALQFFEHSEAPSPTQSPRVSSFGEKQQHLSAFPSSISMHSRRSLASPRMIDYLAWSFIHWLWLRRSPLMIQMRIFIQERVATIYDELTQRDKFPNSPSRRSRRISSVFSKPRKSLVSGSAPSSANSTPRNSFLGPSISMPMFTEFGASASTLQVSTDSTRQAGYARLASPSSPSRRASQESNAPKIVHLGPVSPNTALASLGLPRSVSPGGTRLRDVSVRTLAREMTVTSPLLIRMTYRRIRLVQHLMGYRTLLPMNGSTFGEDDNPDAEVKAWTKRDALDAVAQETKDLLDEFRENFSFDGDEGVIVESGEQGEPDL